MAAGGHYVAAAGVADEGGDAAFDEVLLEYVDDFGGGFVERQGAGIPRDEIYFASFEGREEFYDALGVGEGIVDAAEHDVFEHQVFPGAERVFAAGLHECGERIFFVDGHQCVALFVVGGVEGNGQAGSDGFVGEFFDAGNDAAGGERGVFWRDGDAFGIEEEAERGGHIFKIKERLALAHEDDVGVGLKRLFVFFERDEDLRDDFAGSEIADEAELRSEAELAIDGAAGLRGNADGLAAVAGHEDGFNAGGARSGAVVTGWEREEVADGAVDGVVALADDGERDFGFVGEAFAEGGGERGHFGEFQDALDVEGLVELGAAVGGLAERDGEVGELLFGFAEEFEGHEICRLDILASRLFGSRGGKGGKEGRR